MQGLFILAELLISDKIYHIEDNGAFAMHIKLVAAKSEQSKILLLISRYWCPIERCLHHWMQLVMFYDILLILVRLPTSWTWNLSFEKLVSNFLCILLTKHWSKPTQTHSHHSHACQSMNVIMLSACNMSIYCFAFTLYIVVTKLTEHVSNLLASPTVFLHCASKNTWAQILQSCLSTPKIFYKRFNTLWVSIMFDCLSPALALSRSVVLHNECLAATSLTSSNIALSNTGQPSSVLADIAWFSRCVSAIARHSTPKMLPRSAINCTPKFSLTICF